VQLAAEISIALAWRSTDFATSTLSLFPPQPQKQDIFVNIRS
jgi:hypothetical protein